MIDPIKVIQAMSSGLSSVCATCERYWTARDMGIPGDGCLAKDGCGSPMSGDTFHEYVGPIIHFDRFCFVCGNSARHGVRVDGHVRVIGVCTEHVKLVETLKPEGMKAANVVVISKSGEVRISEDYVSKEPMVLKIRDSTSG